MSNKVVEYVNVQGSRIIAAQDKDGNWSALCLATPGHIHRFKWTPEQFVFDSEGAEVRQIMGVGPEINYAPPNTAYYEAMHGARDTPLEDAHAKLQNQIEYLMALPDADPSTIAAGLIEAGYKR